MSARRPCCALCGKSVYVQQDLVQGREQLIRWALEHGVALARPGAADLHLGCASALRRQLAEKVLAPLLGAGMI